MMEKKPKFEAFVAGAGKNAKGLLDHAIQAVDQNDDGRFDLADVAVIAGAAGDTVKRGVQAVKDQAQELELKFLRPIFADSLSDVDFQMPNLIRLIGREKKFAEKEVFQGAIGYISDQKEIHIMNIFRDAIEAFGLTFYPDHDYEFYYIDPSDRRQYIALDEYFSYLKVARINELQRIAQDLGARHFRVTYKEEQASFSKEKVKAHAKAGIKADAGHDLTEKKYSTVEIAAEMEFPGHAPIRPQLNYMQKDPSVQTLVSMRMDEQAPLLHQKFMLKLSNSSGMKESDAVKIDAVLKKMKCAGNTTVASEAKNESRRYLEYDIEF